MEFSNEFASGIGVESGIVVGLESELSSRPAVRADWRRRGTLRQCQLCLHCSSARRFANFHLSSGYRRTDVRSEQTLVARAGKHAGADARRPTLDATPGDTRSAPLRSHVFDRASDSDSPNALLYCVDRSLTRSSELGAHSRALK